MEQNPNEGNASHVRYKDEVAHTEGRHRLKYTWRRGLMGQVKLINDYKGGKT